VRGEAPGRRATLGLLLGFLGIAALLVVGGTLGTAGATGSGLRTDSGAAPVSANVVFNGVSVNGHTSTSSAIPSSFNNPYTTTVYWNATSGTALVTSGTLTLLFAGISVGTSNQGIVNAAPGSSGHVTLTSDFTQDKYLFEGVYELQASLFDNGTLLFQQSFYVWIQAADHLTIVNVALILIGAWEVYQFAALASVRAARKELGIEQPKPPTPPPTTPPGA
jgi:hypothetical protein